MENLMRRLKGLSFIPFKSTLSFLFENLSKTGRTKKQLLSFAIDASMVTFCLWSAFSLRLGEPYSDFLNIAHLLVLLPPITVLIFGGLGVYRWIVRASSRRQFEQLVKGAILSSMALLTLLYLYPVTFAPRSVFVIYGVLLVVSTVGVRLVWAKIHNGAVESQGIPVAIYGAGAAGRQFVNLVRLSDEYHPRLFLDDNAELSGGEVSGMRVYCPSDPNTAQVLAKYEIEAIIVAISSISGSAYARLVSSVARFKLPVKTIPSIHDIVSGKSSPDDVREIRLEDLLGRHPVKADPVLLKKNITGKRVLVTGAGGSIGSELCRQIAQFGPERLILLDHAEPSLYLIDKSLREQGIGQTIKLTACLASVTDASRIDRLMREHKPHTVYHAAAYKHVPMVEQNPFEGVKTNVFGTLNLVEACETHGVDTFVMVSTDKAVRPTNVMGATKRLAELIVQAKAASADQRLTLSMVRFGNVLGSSGSVIPLFRQQIEAGGPVTVTHPEMTRYFMLIPEAVSLVIQAGAMAKGGELFLLDMGKPVKILDLAKTMIKLHGLNYCMSATDSSEGDMGKEIPIKLIGIRPGEKLHEELLIDDQSFKTQHPKILRANESFVDAATLESNVIARLHAALHQEDVDQLKQILADFVSGYPDKEIASREAVVAYEA